MRVGVYGSAGGTALEQARELARTVGKVVGERGHTVITGACAGLPHEAALAAHEVGGNVIGYSPHVSAEAHEASGLPTDIFEEMFFVPADYKHKSDIRVTRKYRNVSSVAEVDAAIFIGGRMGTMNEFTLAHDFMKNIGILKGSGGVSDRVIKVLLKDLDKESESHIVFEKDPVILVEKLEQL